MSIVTKMSKKGQILVPRLLRRISGLEPGANVQLVETERGILVKAVPKDPIAAVRGCLKKGPSLTKELLKERRWELQKEEEFVQRFSSR